MLESVHAAGGRIFSQLWHCGLSAPAGVKLGALHAAVKPFGNPAAMLMLDPVAPVAKVAPPTGVAVTVTVFAETDNTESVCGDRFSRIPGAV